MSESAHAKEVPSADLGRVGFVGIGRMGAAMFQCVLETGFKGCVYDVQAAAVAPFLRGDHDVVAAVSPADLARTCTVIDVVVNTDQHVLDACLGDDGILAGSRPGAIILLHSTIAHETLRAVATEADSIGVAVLDAAISGKWGHMSVGDLCVMVGGDEQAFAAVRPVLESYGGLVVHLGPLGKGLDTKLALNLLRYQTMMATKEANALLQAAEVDAPFWDIVDHTGAMGFSAGQPPDPKVIESELRTPERLRNNAATARKDLRAAVARGDELGVELIATATAVKAVHTIWGIEGAEDPSSD
jgi:3-hydroxyisobutyrate dehydrogenase